MGKLIQCSSVIARHPYCFPMTRTRVYSIEEVCYYIRNNIYLMQEEVFDADFAHWLREELKMEETAQKLERMQKNHNNLKDIVVTLCCSCDYYTEEEIGGLIAIMDKTQNLSAWGKRKIKADNFLRCKSLERAKKEYSDILRCDDMLQASSKDYGAVYHSLGVAYAGLGEFRQAAANFQMAYEKNRKMESMQCWLYSLRLGGFEEEYEKTVKELELSQEQQVFIDARYNEEAARSRQCRDCRQIRRICDEEGKPQKFMERADEMIAQWKNDYRLEIG